MIRIRPLLAAAAAAGMMAVGCDYWRNLVDDKTVTRHRLDIRVFDVWTNQPLPEAICEDRQRGLRKPADADGRISIPDAGTGTYSLTCSDPLYYDGHSGFNLGSEGVTAEVAMARRGGKGFWYPDDIGRQVQILYPSGLAPWTDIRYPSDFQVRALPEDSGGRFRYIWQFASAPTLNRDSNSTKVRKSVYDLHADAPHVATGTDTLTLIVKSRLNGSANEYEVGRFTKVFNWVMNLKPVLHMISPIDTTQYFKVGCPEPEGRPFRFNFSASDPDGVCRTVRIRTPDTSAALGAVDLEYNCDRHELILPWKKPPSQTSLKVDETSYTRNRLQVTVTDENGTKSDSTLEFWTYANMLPTVKASISKRYDDIFTDEIFWVKYAVHDSDWAVDSVITTWGVGNGTDFPFQTNKYYGQRGLRNFTDSIPYKYAHADTGIRSINVRIQDGCLSTVFAYAGPVRVRKNHDPEIVSLKFFRLQRTLDTTYHVFELALRDMDILGEDQDQYKEVHVDWGDGTFTDYAADFDAFRSASYIKHYYAAPPMPGEKYPITVIVQDSHRGSAKLDTVMVLPPNPPQLSP